MLAALISQPAPVVQYRSWQTRHAQRLAMSVVFAFVALLAGGLRASGASPPAADLVQAELIADLNEVASLLMGRFWPGALTIVFNKLPTFHSMALAKQQTVALRVPDHDVVIDLIRTVGQPITGTSANRAGARAPVSAAEVGFGLGEMVALIIDSGRTSALR